MSDRLENPQLGHNLMDSQPEIPAWGMLARFVGTDEFLEAIEHLREDGFRSLEAYTPFPLEGLDERLGLKRSPMPWIILAGGILGGSSVYTLEYWINLYAY